jgi:hypothetical protein
MERVDWPMAEKSLQEGYKSLRREAELLREELQAIKALGRIPTDDDEMLSKLQAISNGKVASAVSMSQPLAVRAVAREILATPEKAQEMIITDFEDFFRWGTSQNPPLEIEAIRQRLVARNTLLEAVLPDSMQQSSAAALAHVEREYLRRKYVNSETLLMDPIEDIPQEKFFVSEDNYAWDMDELAQAIEAQDGVMRNPLSKVMFSEADIRRILAHPLGRRLKPLQLAQDQLKNGIRPATIERIEKLGHIMLADNSMDAAPSQVAMDEFMAHILTLPKSEQKAISSLKIPGVDGNTGQPFDYTIGESVRDAKDNTTCFHKVFRGHFFVIIQKKKPF